MMLERCSSSSGSATLFFCFPLLVFGKGGLLQTEQALSATFFRRWGWGMLGEMLGLCLDDE